VRIKAEVGIVGVEQRAPGADTHIEFDSEIGVAIAVVVANVRIRPSGRDRQWLLEIAPPIPSSTCRPALRVSGDAIASKYVIITSLKPTRGWVDVLGPFRRPVPVQEITLRVTPGTSPLDGLPEVRNAAVEILLGACAAVKILSCDKKAFHQERCFHQVSAVIEHAKHWQRLASAAVHKVGPGAVVALARFRGSRQSSRDVPRPELE